MFIATDYRGIQLVKCSECGEIYPVDYHGCPECGATTIMIMERKDEKSKTN